MRSLTIEEPDQLGGYSILELRDTGPRPYATGDVKTDEAGKPASYTVAAGDTMISVAERFCIYHHYLYMMNAVRRGSHELFVGDTLNLNPYTVETVGDINGVVQNNEPVGPLPPQR
ncbi:hypothetical protein [Cryobacterium sp. BB307]|uniref:hypothetical protein n=1 Tax=Cryobacterium sp. BB307 TaxID=2716317 RepID=UPI0014461610|nr:hypothetical protein [Cryobacterium sp. BB307]